MNKDHISGSIKEVKGRVKEEVGHFTQNKSMEGSGILDRVKGKVQQGIGDIKDSVKGGINKALQRNRGTSH